MKEYIAPVITLFKEQPPHETQATPEAAAAAELGDLLESIARLCGPGSQVSSFYERLSHNLEAWHAETPADTTPDEYTLTKLNEVIAQHPALQVHLGRRTMRRPYGDTSTYDPFPEL